jgi:hypothetical protein
VSTKEAPEALVNDGNHDGVAAFVFVKATGVKDARREDINQAIFPGSGSDPDRPTGAIIHSDLEGGVYNVHVIIGNKTKVAAVDVLLAVRKATGVPEANVTCEDFVGISF